MIRDGAIYFYLKDEEHGWLSNFYPSPFCMDGTALGRTSWPTNEHYYQAQKAVSSDFAQWIRASPNPYHAMRAGRALRIEKNEMWPNWDERKARVMLDGLRGKFYQNPVLRRKLIATDIMPIHEDSPTDMYWGVKGEDVLGKLLMRVRTELRPC